MPDTANSTSTPVRLAVVGAGFIGKKHIQTILDEAAAELVAIVDPLPAGRDLAAQCGVEFHDDVHQMLKSTSPDGVIVCTPTEAHLEPVLASLEAGAHVLAEKPITATAEEARRIVEKARQTRAHVLVGHHRRHAPVLARAAKIIADGEIGQLITVNGQWTVKKDDNYFSPDWRQRRAAGPVLTNLIHEIDAIRYMCGEIRSISAEVSNTVRGFDKEDAAALVMTFVSGAIGTFVVCDGTPSPWTWEQATGENPVFPTAKRNTHHFTGTTGSLEFPRLAIWRHGENSGGWHDPIERQRLADIPADAFERQCAHFCAVIRGTEAPLITAEDGAKTLAATLAVFEAAETGRRVML